MSLNKNKIDFFLLGRVLVLAKPYKSVFIIASILAVVLALISALPEIIDFLGKLPGWIVEIANWIGELFGQTPQ